MENCNPPSRSSVHERGPYKKSENATAVHFRLFKKKNHFVFGLRGKTRAFLVLPHNIWALVLDGKRRRGGWKEYGDLMTKQDDTLGREGRERGKGTGRWPSDMEHVPKDVGREEEPLIIRGWRHYSARIVGKMPICLRFHPITRDTSFVGAGETGWMEGPPFSDISTSKTAHA